MARSVHSLATAKLPRSLAALARVLPDGAADRRLQRGGQRGCDLLRFLVEHPQGAFAGVVPERPRVALLSIGVSAAFGLRYSIYGVIWRRIARTLRLPKTEPEHEYPPRFAQTLGTANVLEGSVRKAGDRLRVSARLVSSDGYELWSRRDPIASGP